MTSVCNKLEKLRPPSFVTTKSADRREVVLSWSTVVLKSKYSTFKDLLNSEITILSGYIERKGTQLRLEKALMLTRQIHKVAQRWRLNDFYPQLKQFENSIGTFDDKTGCLAKKDSRKDERLPSSQWANWVIYLALRDSALLSKIVVECENTIKFWLGLIASGHHWGDSLVICGILSRLWFLSSNLLEDFIHVIYPTLLKLSHCLKPNRSGAWPDTKFVVPSDLYKWIRQDMKLPYKPIDLSKDFTLVRKENAPSKLNLSFLSTYFEADNEEEEEESKLGVPEKAESEEVIETEIPVQQNKALRKKRQKRMEYDKEEIVDDDDLGMVVERVQPPPMKKQKLKEKAESKEVIETEIPVQQNKALRKKRRKRMEYDKEEIVNDDEEDLGMVVEQVQPPPKKKQKLKEKKKNRKKRQKV